MEVPSQAYVSKTRIGVLAVSSMGMAALAITPSYAAIAKTFALSNTSVQMLTSLPNLFMMIAGLIIGKLTASKINLKTLTISAIILVVIGGFMPLAFHTSFMFLLFCSCLVGLGQGACTNLSQVLISQMLPEKERQSTMGLTAAIDLDYDHGLNAVIVADANGNQTRIEAHKVIFADGGYCGNTDMMAEKYTDADKLLNLGERKSDGTGIRLAKKLGAVSTHTPVLFAHGCAPSFKINPMQRASSVEALTNLPLLWVDQTANRFVNEDVVYDFAMWGNAAHNVGGKYYVIVDQKTLDHFKTMPVELEDTFERQFCEVGETPRTTVGPLPNIQQDFDQARQTGEVVKAESLTALANKLNLPLSALNRTIKTYNQAVTAQQDDVFLKPSDELLFDVTNGPVYAIVEHCAILGTLDGVDVNRNCEPLTADGAPIKDLYVVGNNVNGLYSDGYPSYEGIANGFAFVSGWIAAQEAVNCLAQEKVEA